MNNLIPTSNSSIKNLSDQMSTEFLLSEVSLLESNPRTSGALHTGVDAWAWNVVVAWNRVRFYTQESPSLTHLGEMETTKCSMH